MNDIYTQHANTLQFDHSKDNKKRLYAKVEIVRNFLEFDTKNISNLANIILNKEICDLFFINFSDYNLPEGFNGFLDKTIGQFPKILINAQLDNYNFVLAHEVMHLFLTPHDASFSCLLTRNFLNSTDNYEEWRANEGGAELLVPYKHFIPDYIDNIDFYDQQSLITLLSNKYKVSTTVIKYRISNLKNEIAQYQNGTKVDDIKIF